MFNLTGQNFIEMIQYIDSNARSASGGSEVVTRCKFCGDSKDPKHAHFYMSVPQGPEDVSLYHCKKCSAYGIVDDELLRKLGCTDSNVLIEITKHNAEVLSLPKYKYLKKIDIYPLRWDLIRKESTNQQKLDYINRRIGVNFSFADLVANKIFLNLGDIIQTNGLELTRDQKICTSLDQYFIGFISYDNSFANMRKVTDKELYHSINKRYINYSLVGKSDTGKNFYIIPGMIDILDSAPIRIHIAEGPFDILSICYNLNRGHKYQNIYISCGGKSYSQALEFIIEEFGLINYEVHFYPDADVSDNEFSYKVMSKVKVLPCDFYIHRNAYPKEKDYGVPSDRIKDSFRYIPNDNVF